MSKEPEEFIGVQARCPECNTLVSVKISKVQAKALYKSYKGKYN